jgi:hypothetical protein
MRPHNSLALGLLVAFQLVIGRSTALAQAPAPSAGTRSQTVAACLVLTPQEIERISKLRNTFNMPPEGEGVSTTATGCHYLEFDFQLTRPMTREAFIARRDREARSGHKIQPVSGVGDDAYFWEQPSASNGLLAIGLRVGQSEFGIQVMLPADSVAVMKPVLLELAKAAAPKLR